MCAPIFSEIHSRDELWWWKVSGCNPALPGLPFVMLSEGWWSGGRPFPFPSAAPGLIAVAPKRCHSGARLCSRRKPAIMHSWRSQRQARIHLKGGFIFAFLTRLRVRSSRVRVLETRPAFHTEVRKAGGGQVFLWRACDLRTPQGRIDLLFVRLAWILCDLLRRSFYSFLCLSRKLRKGTTRDDYWLLVARASLVMQRFQPTVHDAKSLSFTNQFIGHGEEGRGRWVWHHICVQVDVLSLLLHPKDPFKFRVIKNVLFLPHKLKSRGDGNRSNSECQI